MTKEKTIDLFAWWERARPFLWPWFLLPFSMIYVLDFVAALVTILQIICGCYLMLNIIAIGFGITIFVIDQTEGRFKDLPESRLAKVFVGLKYGHQMGLWLMGSDVLTSGQDAKDKT